MAYLVPGPTEFNGGAVAKGYSSFMGSPDIDKRFLETYRRAESLLLQALYHPLPFTAGDAEHSVAIMTGEAMVGLWAGLSSTLTAGDVVVAVGTGLYGEGIGGMAKSRGATVVPVNFEWDSTFSAADVAPGGRIHAAIVESKPKMVTAVHVETPSGTVNPISVLGKLCREVGALFYVDIVSGFLGETISIKEACIDIALVGTQKCLSLAADLAIVGVSERAWDVIAQKETSANNYSGYDSLFPFRGCSMNEEPIFPYTMHWNAIEVLADTLEAHLRDGTLERTLARHQEVAAYCRERVEEIGLELFVPEPSSRSATVTAVKLPSFTTWEEFTTAAEDKGLSLGGSYGKLAGKIFRIGHMGRQADMTRVRRGLDVLEEVMLALKKSSK